MYRKLMTLLLICALICFSSGCGAEGVNPTEIVPTHAEGISPIRTGCRQQSIATIENNFETTDTGVYVLYFTQETHSVLLYCDHDSDIFVPLCSRPDCTHNDEKCDAWYESCINVCYYEGYLYIVRNDTSSGAQNFQLLRVDLDGRNRKVVMETADTIRGYSA